MINYRYPGDRFAIFELSGFAALTLLADRCQEAVNLAREKLDLIAQTICVAGHGLGTLRVGIDQIIHDDGIVCDVSRARRRMSDIFADLAGCNTLLLNRCGNGA